MTVVSAALPDLTDAGDLSGYLIHATDGEIGKVDSHDMGTGESYLLVATGHWISHKTVLLPARLIDRIDHASQAVYVKCSQDTVRGAPAYRDDRAHRGDLDVYYGKMLGHGGLI